MNYHVEGKLKKMTQKVIEAFLYGQVASIGLYFL